MNGEQARKTLQNAGFSQYQADVYITTLQLGSASATEIASASNVPKSRIYDVLRNLDDKGYIETYKQDTLRARAINPDKVLETLRDQATSFTETADKIEETWREPSVGDHRITLVQREETVVESAKQAIQEATTEIQLSVTADHFATLRPFLHEARGRGVVIKISLQAPSSEVDYSSLDFEGVATEVRYRNLPAPFVALVDRQKTFFISQDDINEIGIMINNYTLTYVFHWYFQLSLWEIWDEIYRAEEDTPPNRYVNVREFIRDLNQLLTGNDSVGATVVGYDTETKEEVTLEGNIVDIAYTGASPETERIPLSEVAGRATIYLDTGEEIVTVGNWGAIEEDVEGRDIRMNY